ncbi:MAG TPA: hypothetical protein VK963_00215 [Candidatus Saccharimonadales bacterium]|nr:hypothetical protein [Candidatus Saccharimonadales bacterium]
MIENERTYLAKSLPDLSNSSSSEMLDIYIPRAAEHPVLRIRCRGEKCEITKKEPVQAGDASRQSEQTIGLTETEFNELAGLEGKRIRKIRYVYDYQGRQCEIDVFQDHLEGLVLVDFEFAEAESQAMERFELPDFCLAEVTQETFIAGGMLCGKSYGDIEGELARFNYQKLTLHQEA